MAYIANLIPTTEFTVIHLNQYEYGIDNVVTVAIFNGDTPFTIPDGSTIVVTGTRPDGKEFVSSEWVLFEDNEVIFEVQAAMTAVYGEFEFEIVISNGDNRWSTTNLKFNVERSPINAETPISEDEIPACIDVAHLNAMRAQAAASEAVEAAESVAGDVDDAKEAAISAGEYAVRSETAATTAESAAITATEASENVENIIEEATESATADAIESATSIATTAANSATAAADRAEASEENASSSANVASEAATRAQAAYDALADTISETIAQTMPDEVATQVALMQIHEGQTVIDSTLSVQGAAAEAVAVRDAIDDATADVIKFASEDNIAFVATNYGHYINYSYEVAENAGLRCSDYVEVPKDVASVTYRQMIQIDDHLANVYPSLILYDSNKAVISSISPPADNTNEFRTLGLNNQNIRYIRFNQGNIGREDSDRALFRFNKLTFSDIYTTIKNGIPYLTQGGHVADGADIFTLKPNKVYDITYGSSNKTNLPYEGFLGIIVPFHATATTYPSTATFIIAISSSNRFFVTRSWGTDATFSSWVEFPNSSIINEAIEQISKNTDNLTAFASNNDLSFLADNYGNYVNTSNEVVANAILRCSDYIEVPKNASSVTFRQMIESNGSLINVYPAMVSYKADKTVYAYHSTSGTDEYRTMGLDPSIIRYVRINQANINRSDVGRSMLKFNVFSANDLYSAIRSGMQYVTQGGSIPANSDLFTLKPNKVYHLTSNSATMSNLPYEGFLGMVIPFNAVYTTYPAITTFIIAISSTNRFFVAHSWGSTTFSSWVELEAADDTIFKYRTHLTSGADVDSFTEMGVYLLATGIEASHKPFSDVACHLAAFVDSYGNLSQLAISSDGRIAYRYKKRYETDFSSWNYALNDSFVGDYSGEFTSEKQIVDTGISLEAGVNYIVVNNPISNDQPYTGFYNIFIRSNPSAYSKHIGKYQTVQRFTPTLTGTLGIYNPVGDGGYGYVGDVSISVYKEADFLPHQKKIVTVGKDANSYDFTSFTAALLALKDNTDEKEIHIYPGEYDLFQEYNDAGVPVYEGDSPTYDYFDYCVWIPANTHIIGHGIVRLNWMPEGNQVTSNQSQTVSPINVAGSMTLENVEIHTKNSRYCIHDDPLGKREYIMAVKRYINVRCYKYANDTGKGWTHTLGFGFDMGDRYEFHNCMFINTAYGRTLYGHARSTSEDVLLTEVASPNIIVDNCVMKTNGSRCVVFGNVLTSAPLHIRVDMNNCYVSGEVYIADEGSAGDGGTRRNAFDLKVLGGNITSDKVIIRSTNNPYSPQIYSFN